MARPILPDRMRELRRRLGMPLHILAERAGLSKDSLWRIENGTQPGNREETQRRLARVLEVDPRVLTGERPLPEVVDAPRRRWTVEMTEASRNAVVLAARRYHVPEALIVELAPLLFVLVAEASLGRRRAALAGLETALAKMSDAGGDVPHFAGIGEVGPEVRAAVVAEERSIAAREIFGADIDAALAVSLSDEGSDAAVDNPFATFLAEDSRRASVASPGVAAVARLTPKEVAATLCREEAHAAGGGAEDLVAAILGGRVGLADMPEVLWQDGQARLDWLRNHIK